MKTTITPSVSGDICYVIGQFEWLLSQSPVDRFTDVFGITVSGNMVYNRDGSRRYLANKTVYSGVNATSSTPAGTTYLYSGNHVTAIKFNLFDDVLTDDYNYTVYSKHRGAVSTYFTMTEDVGSAAAHYWHATGVIVPSISVGSEIGVGVSYENNSI